MITASLAFLSIPQPSQFFFAHILQSPTALSLGKIFCLLQGFETITPTSVGFFYAPSASPTVELPAFSFERCLEVLMIRTGHQTSLYCLPCPHFLSRLPLPPLHLIFSSAFLASLAITVISHLGAQLWILLTLVLFQLLLNLCKPGFG